MIYSNSLFSFPQVRWLKSLSRGVEEVRVSLMQVWRAVWLLRFLTLRSECVSEIRFECCYFKIHLWVWWIYPINSMGMKICNRSEIGKWVISFFYWWLFLDIYVPFLISIYAYSFIYNFTTYFSVRRCVNLMMSKVWIKKSVAPRMKERKRGSEREKK